MQSKSVLNSDHSSNHQECSTHLKLSLSKILTPVKYAMSGTQNNDNTEFDTIVESKFDPRTQHKPWCAYLHNNLPAYFYQMLVQSKTNIGPVGEYIYDSSLMDIDTSIDSNQPPTRKEK